MKNLYLALAILGALTPYAFFIRHFADQGLALQPFLSALFVNPAAGGFTTDLFISSLVFWIAMFVKRRRAAGPSPWLFVVLNLTIGLSCALPAYLYARELAPSGRAQV